MLVVPLANSEQATLPLPTDEITAMQDRAVAGNRRRAARGCIGAYSGREVNSERAEGVIRRRGGASVFPQLVFSPHLSLSFTHTLLQSSEQRGCLTLVILYHD